MTFNAGTDPAAAAAAAAAADVAVVFGYQRMGEFSDLPDLRLQGNGDALIAAVAAANAKTVVVLQTGSAVEMPWLGDVAGGARDLVRAASRWGRPSPPCCSATSARRASCR